MHIILFNGPPSSGKDTAVEALMNTCLVQRKVATHRKFVSHVDYLVQSVLSRFGLGDYSHGEYMNAIKDTVLKEKPIINGRSARDLRIQFAEHFAKPVFGKEIFGKVLGKEVAITLADVVFISDCGFQEEYDAFCEALCERTDVEITLVTLVRDGCNFDNDSRNYIDGLNAYTHNCYRVENNGSLEELKQKLEGLLFT